MGNGIFSIVFHIINFNVTSLCRECVSSCPEGTYSSETKECLGCHETCAMCSGPAQNQCLACHTGYLYVLHLGLCVESCPQGYYPGKSNGLALFTLIL